MPNSKFNVQDAVSGATAIVDVLVSAAGLERKVVFRTFCNSHAAAHRYVKDRELTARKAARRLAASGADGVPRAITGEVKEVKVEGVKAYFAMPSGWYPSSPPAGPAATFHNGTGGESPAAEPGEDGRATPPTADQDDDVPA